YLRLIFELLGRIISSPHHSDASIRLLCPWHCQLVVFNDADGVDAAVIHRCKAGQVPRTSHTAKWERCAPVPEHRDAGMLDSVLRSWTHGPGINGPSRRLPAVSGACASSQGRARSIGGAMYAQSWPSSILCSEKATWWYGYRPR
ncbi:hypothetical protein CSPX01_00326, partial [Colletotrichum filicis]